MKKENVLKKNWEFQEIINLKNQKVSNNLIFYYRKSENHLKVGISVSKKFANAVLRNKYKRQMRNALDVLKPWDKKYDIIIILRKKFLKLKFAQKVEELKNMFERF